MSFARWVIHYCPRKRGCPRAVLSLEQGLIILFAFGTLHIKIISFGVTYVLLALYVVVFGDAGGLDEALQCIISECQQQSVPFVFALSRSALGRACVRKVPVSIVGIFNYDGAEVSSLKIPKICVGFEIRLAFKNQNF